MKSFQEEQLSSLKTFQDIYEIAYLNPTTLKWRVEVLFSIEETLAFCALLQDYQSYFKVRFRNLVITSEDLAQSLLLLDLFFNRLSGRFLKDSSE